MTSATKAVSTLNMTTPPSDAVGENSQVAINLDKTALTDWINQGEKWVFHSLLSIDTALQIGIIIACFAVGALIGRALTPKFQKGIASLHLPASFDALMQKTKRLMGALIVLLMLFLSVMAIASSGLSIGFVYIDATMRLLAAWIIIRLAVQGIHNSFMRKLIGGFIWFVAALSVFGALDSTTEVLGSMGLTLGSFRLSALTFVKALFATIVMTYMASAISHMVEKRLDRIPAMTAGSRLLITKIVRMTLILLAVIIGITMAGINLSVLAVFSGAVGLGVGLGLQKSVSNLFTGITLLLDRTIQPGDILELQGGAFGIVRQMGSRCTEIITLDEKSYLIPNEDLVANPVINWSRSGSKIQLSIDFGVGYEQDPKAVIALAIDAAAKVKRVLKSPTPACKMKSFREGMLEFTLIFWIEDAARGLLNVKSEILINLWESFRANNVTIPYNPKTIYTPATDSHVKV